MNFKERIKDYSCFDSLPEDVFSEFLEEVSHPDRDLDAQGSFDDLELLLIKLRRKGLTNIHIVANPTSGNHSVYFKESALEMPYTVIGDADKAYEWIMEHKP